MSFNIRSCLATLAWCLCAGLSSVTHAADLALSNTPLFVAGNVEPNVYFLVDDSGSMELEWLVEGLSEEDVDYRYVLPVKGNNKDWNAFDDFEPVRVIPTEEALEAAVAAARPGAPVQSLIWQMRSHEYNFMYYNPNIDYRPWAGTDADGNHMHDDAVATAAKVDPINTDLDGDGTDETLAERTVDLTVTTAPFTNRQPKEFDSDLPDGYQETIFPATYYLPKDFDGDGEIGPNDRIKVEIKPVEADGTPRVFKAAKDSRPDCSSSDDDNDICTYAEEIQNFANWFQYHRKRSFAARAAMAMIVENLSGIRLGLHMFSEDDPLDLPLSLTASDNKVSVLNTVHSLPIYCFTNPDVSRCWGTPARKALFELGQRFVTNDDSPDDHESPILSAAEGGACQQNFAVVVTDGYWNAPSFSAEGIDDNDSDGNTDYDDDAEWGFKDDVRLTLADVAMHFYETDLNTDLDDLVDTVGDETIDLSRVVPPVALDDAKHQRLITYTVAFGIEGYALDPFNETDAEDDTFPTAEGFVWTNVRDPSLSVDERTQTRIDDLFHAAYNGRGIFLSAENPNQLSSDLERVFGDIVDRTARSGASVALTSGTLSSDTLLFQVRFDPKNWTGQLLAVPVINTGLPSDVGRPSTLLQFEAGCVLTGGACPTIARCAIDEDDCTDSASTTTYPGQSWNPSDGNGRTILTWRLADASVDGHGIKFAWPSNPDAPGDDDLSPAQIAFLKWNPAAPESPLSDNIGEARLQFLRGRQDLSNMRDRESLLGDIVSSTPAYVAAPLFAYPDGLEQASDASAQAYSDYVASNASRTPMIYVGANDGMLHGFNATSGTDGGREEIAYIPSPVYRNLWRLTDKGYGATVGHRFFVNGSPAVGDALFSDDKKWHTILVGTLGQGGQGVFAMDITDPGDFDEGDPGKTVLWEFTDVDLDTDTGAEDIEGGDADLGYTYGKAHIVRLYNGDWAAVFSNGYNNTEDDTGEGGQQSTTGNGVLYVLDIETGELIRRFDTGHGTAQDPEGLGRPNGLAEPTPVDIDGDRITDTIYVPDLFGNVFKIDVTGTCKVPSGPPSGCESSWDFSLGGGAVKTPLYIAKDADGNHQPITSRIEVGLHPTQPGTMIYFGTGKYMETTDSANNDLQTFYGVWDRNNGAAIPSANRDALLSQEIIEEITDTFDLPDGAGINTEQLRLSTTDLVDWETQNGWYMDLVLNPASGSPTPDGERLVANPVLRDGRIIFVTTMPASDPCTSGGDSWLMELSASDGARLPVSPFDLNKDGLFTESDLAGGANEVSSGIKLKEITVSSPGILEDGISGYGGDGGGAFGREYKYFSGSQSGQLDYLMESSGRTKGRQSWRQIWSN